MPSSELDTPHIHKPSDTPTVYSFACFYGIPSSVTEMVPCREENVENMFCNAL